MKTPSKLSALEKAVSLLARRDHGTEELRRKLLDRGYEHTAVEAAMARLAEKGYLDDIQFVQSYARYRAQLGFGPKHIMQTLCAKGVSKTDVSCALSLVDIDWQQSAKIAQGKKFLTLPSNWETYQKQAAFLQYRGHEISMIEQVLSYETTDHS